MTAATARKTAPLFAALGDPVRLGIVLKLGQGGPLPTSTLQQGAGVTRQGVTKHLRLLEDAGLVTSERAGRDRLWRIEAQRMAEMSRMLTRVSAQWDARSGSDAPPPHRGYGAE